MFQVALLADFAERSAKRASLHVKHVAIWDFVATTSDPCGGQTPSNAANKKSSSKMRSSALKYRRRATSLHNCKALQHRLRCAIPFPQCQPQPRFTPTRQCRTLVRLRLKLLTQDHATSRVSHKTATSRSRHTLNTPHRMRNTQCSHHMRSISRPSVQFMSTMFKLARTPQSQHSVPISHHPLRMAYPAILPTAGCRRNTTRICMRASPKNQ